MEMTMIDHPLAAGPILAPTTHAAKNRAREFILASSAIIDPLAARRDPIVTECFVAPAAEFVLAATCCYRPMLLPECATIARATGFDMILLRYDADRGASFDVLFRQTDRWLCRYLAWRRRGGDLWLIPSAGDNPYIRIRNSGISRVLFAPFACPEERSGGTILATGNPSFEGNT